MVDIVAAIRSRARKRVDEPVGQAAHFLTKAATKNRVPLLCAI